MDATDDRKRPRAKQTIDVGCGIYSMCTSSDGKKAILGTSKKESNVCLVDIFCGAEDSKAVVKKYEGHTTPIYSCCISPDTSYIGSGGKNGLVAFHDVSREQPVSMAKGHESTLYSCDFNADNQHVCTSSSDGTIKIWDIKSDSVSKNKAAAVIEDAAAMGTVYQALWHGENHILSCGDDYCIKRWDKRSLSGGPVANYFGHTSIVKSIAVSECGYFLVSACDDGSIRVWLADEQTLIADMHGGVQRKLQAKEKELDKLSQQVSEGEVDIKDVQKVREVKEELQKSSDHYDKVKSERGALGCIQARVGLEGHNLAVACVAWKSKESEEGKPVGQILSGAQDQTIRLFELDLDELKKF